MLCATAVQFWIEDIQTGTLHLDAPPLTSPSLP